MEKEKDTSSHRDKRQRGKETLKSPRLEMEESFGKALQEIASTEAFAQLWESGAIEEGMRKIQDRIKCGSYALSPPQLNADLQELCNSVREIGEREDDQLIQCSNKNCGFKYYLTRCMKPPLGSAPLPGVTWYCPSCLCRECFLLENNAPTILCSGCSDCYHTQCVQPPPEGNWFCVPCVEWQNRLLNSPDGAIKEANRRSVRSKRKIP
ncbi:uncharacterized protein LOC131857728 [Cryptomeria japonica]|uniref:uncharacterized protein LOC131857728 n=1 Tax=Cryptomeria japonica TaxID=3369 RepID=UPI0027DA2FFD|nr:uncharacterized protein LOC131857728 [Cryptomeria japonica]